MPDDLKVWSGQCCLCDIGKPVPGTEFHTGDIVLVWHGQWIGTDAEIWTPCDGLSVVVSDQYETFSNGEINEASDPKPFVMGIKGKGFDDDDWDIRLIKKYSDVVIGEHWPNYGFRYAPQNGR